MTIEIAGQFAHRLQGAARLRQGVREASLQGDSTSKVRSAESSVLCRADKVSTALGSTRVWSAFRVP